MQNTVAYFCLTAGWLVLIVSLVFLILSTFKHTHFKQILLRYLNTALEQADAVFIHGVNVEEVKLHLTDNLAPLR